MTGPDIFGSEMELDTKVTHSCKKNHTPWKVMHADENLKIYSLLFPDNTTSPYRMRQTALATLDASYFEISGLGTY